jgi:hypothetical protein
MQTTTAFPHTPADPRPATWWRDIERAARREGPFTKGVGTTEHWATDLALVGALSGFLAPLAVFQSNEPASVPYLFMTTVAGGISGLVFGAAWCGWLSTTLKRSSLAFITTLAFLCGAAWGAVVGVAGALVVTTNMHADAAFVLCAVACAAVAAALQSAWVVPALAWARGRRRRRHQVVIAAGFASLAFGWLGFLGVVSVLELAGL